ncbi:hypothetical protein TCSYLVIO_009192 [Trypanosoma cruzi]|nr:hypothetical protein TCSYLVIO_009192 [Trypanosoma cruzi]
MRVTYHNNNYVDAAHQQSKKKGSAPRRAPSLTIAGMPRPHNTHNATISCRLSSTKMSATPNAYWRTCSHALEPHGRSGWPSCTASQCPRCAWSTPSHSLDPRLGAARGCRQEQCVWKKQMCGNNGHPHSLRHLHSLHPPTQKGGAMGKRSPPHSACIKEYAAATPSTSQCNKEPCAHTQTTATRGARRIQIHGAVLYFSLPRRIGIASHTHSEARRTPSAPFRVQSAGRVQSPKCHRNGGAQTLVVVDHRCL